MPPMPENKSINVKEFVVLVDLNGGSIIKSLIFFSIDLEGFRRLFSHIPIL